MKKITGTFLTIFTFLFSIHSVSAQEGNFEGAIDVNGVKLEMRIMIINDAEGLSGTLDIPMQGVKGMQLADVKLRKSTLEFNLPEVPGNASYSGKFNDDFSKLDGNFTQGGVELPLVFVKMDDAILQARVDLLKITIDSIRRLQQIPAIGVGIVKNGKVLMAEGFGERDLDKGLKTDANTLFAIGSSSKAFTTMGLGLLADDGKLDWDTPIRNYMPDFELKNDFATQETNAVDLVCHRSGLPRHDLLWYGSGFSRAALFQKLKHLEPSAPFRTKFQYNNLMFMTAGLLIEDLSGQSWEAFTSERIFKPLGMSSSNFSVEKMKSNENAALGYQKIEEEVKAMPYRNIDQIGPAGSINSSVNDMIQWVKFHLNKGKVDNTEIVTSGQIDKMHTPHMVIAKGSPTSPEIQSINYGLGWFTRVYDGIYTVYHGGNIDGFSALVFLQPSKDLGLVILTNMNGTAVPGILANTISDKILNLAERDWYTRVYGETDKEEEKEADEEEDDNENTAIEGTSPTKPIEEYVGTYQHPSYGDMKITITEDDSLHLHYNSFSSTLAHWHYDLFKAKFEILGAMDIYFSLDKNGEIVGVKSTMDPFVEDILFTKLPPDYLNDPKYLTMLTGRYDLSGSLVKVDLVAKELKVSLPGQPQYTLIPFKKTTFQLKGLNGYTVEFILDEKGKSCEGLKFIQPNGTFEATRKKD